jgi:hypothetical protein
VSPGISPIKNQYPGIAIFEVDAATLIPRDLKMMFLLLDSTYGLKMNTEAASLPFRTVSFTDFGLYELTPTALKDFKGRLEQSDSLTYNYLTAKLGFDYNSKTEFQQAMKIYVEDLGLITST